MKGVIKDLATAVHEADPNASFLFEFWDGEEIQFGNQPKVTMRLKTARSSWKMFKEGFLGFGEAYMSKELEVEGDLQELLRLGFAVGFDKAGLSLRRKAELLSFYWKTRGIRDNVHRNISYHYDRTVEFYTLFLDETLTYSCAYFNGEDDTLERAQLNKYRHISRKLMLNEGDTLVDVGCGFGGMLIYAAQECGVRGTGITVSRDQFEYANRKLRELDLQSRIEVKLEDYRSSTGQFDKFVSIGMFEHVGKEFIPVFMKKAADLLKTRGLGLLHTIAKDTDTPTDSWITRYIFPGGYVPNLSEIVGAMGQAGLSILDIENLRMHYARTLDRWVLNFEKNRQKVQEMFGEKFVRMWALYLHASSAAFKYGGNRVYQILFSKGLNDNLPMTRRHLYM